MKPIDHILTQTARTYLGISTLESRLSDDLDFHVVAVWQISAALHAAFAAGNLDAHGSRDSSSNLPLRYTGYEIHGIKEFGEPGHRFCEQVEDAEAEFWSLYGRIPGGGMDSIGDFPSLALAEEVFARITGRRYVEFTTTTEEG